MSLPGDLILEDNPLQMVDIGASGGIDPRWGKFTSFLNGVLFEPDPREYEHLKSKGNNNLTILNTALSDSHASISLHLCEKQEVSSVYKPNFELLERFPNVERFNIIRNIEVNADTLDNQLDIHNIDDIDFVKLDAQGYELPIIKKSGDTLGCVIGMEIEVEFSSIYKGQPLFGDVDKHVRGLGFELIDIKRYYWKRKDSDKCGSGKGQLMFGDALYLRSPEQVILMNGISSNKIMRAISIYLIYGYLDLANTLLNISKKNKLIGDDDYKAIEHVILKVNNKYVLPDFPGKSRIRKIISKIIGLFDSDGPYSGTDEILGNS